MYLLFISYHKALKLMTLKIISQFKLLGKLNSEIDLYILIYLYFWMDMTLFKK